MAGELCFSCSVINEEQLIREIPSSRRLRTSVDPARSTNITSAKSRTTCPCSACATAHSFFSSPTHSPANLPASRNVTCRGTEDRDIFSITNLALALVLSSTPQPTKLHPNPIRSRCRSCLPALVTVSRGQRKESTPPAREKGPHVSQLTGCSYVAALRKLYDGSPRNMVASNEAQWRRWGCHGIQWWTRSMPRRFRRPRSVLGCKPRSFAAPFGPSITQPVWLSKVRICCLSTSASRIGDCLPCSGCVLAAEVNAVLPRSSSAVAEPPDSAGVRKSSWSRDKTEPRESTTPRSMRFCNSRMFPGQS